MIVIKFKWCCTDCPSRESYMHEHTLKVNDVEFTTKSTIGCNHELVCKDYIEADTRTVSETLAEKGE